MATRKEVQVAVNDSERTVTIRFREHTYARGLGPWRQVTFPAREFTKALVEAKVAVPWSALFTGGPR